MAPFITHIYSADPSAHAFEGRVYVYPSHDRETDIAFNDNGDQYDMVDYHVFSTSSLDPRAPVEDHGVVLRLEDIPWAARQVWAPDAACRDGKYYLYFPARDKEGIFRIGVARGDTPAGPFTPDPEPMKGSFSIDPAAFVEPDGGEAYLFFGGIWGGQLQCYQKGNDQFDPAWQGPQEPKGEGVYALSPRGAKLTKDMRGFAEDVKEVLILDPDTGKPLLADDHERRFFEAAWVHKKGDTYYFSYSTGDTHYLCYGTSSSPLGPYTYAGRILEPVLGWTTHHSIVEFDDRWWLFYHDCELSGGVDHLRSVQVKEIFYDEQGKIVSEKPE